MLAPQTFPAPSAPIALTKPETLWRAVFEQSRLGIVLIDPATDRILDLNQRFADLAGRPRDALRGQDWMHLTHPETWPTRSRTRPSCVKVASPASCATSATSTPTARCCGCMSTKPA